MEFHPINTQSQLRNIISSSVFEQTTLDLMRAPKQGKTDELLPTSSHIWGEAILQLMEAGCVAEVALSCYKT